MGGDDINTTHEVPNAYAQAWDQRLPYLRKQQLDPLPMDQLTRPRYEDRGGKHRGFVAAVGHRFGKLDEDTPEMWQEIRAYARNGELPERFKGMGAKNKEVLRFIRRASQFFFLRELPDVLFKHKFRHGVQQQPIRVIDDPAKRMAYIAGAHNECGHRGRDATYHRLSEGFYWPNMMADVAWFVRSCNACQLQSTLRPSVAFGPSALNPALARHFHLDTVHMPEGRTDTGQTVKYFFHAVEALMG
jgi:hypothetical protein